MNKTSQKYEINNKLARLERDKNRANTHKAAREPFKENKKNELFKKQNGICPCCFKSIISINDAEVDHMTPLSRGGKHDNTNFILTHSQCNKEKHNKTLIEHWEWRVKVGLDKENLGKKYEFVK